MVALLAVIGGTMAALSLIDFAVSAYDAWRRRRERHTRGFPPRAVVATCSAEDDARDLETIENDLVHGLLSGGLSPAAYAAAMAWLADRENRYGRSDSVLPQAFWAQAWPGRGKQ